MGAPVTGRKAQTAEFISVVTAARLARLYATAPWHGVKHFFPHQFVFDLLHTIFTQKTTKGAVNTRSAADYIRKTWKHGGPSLAAPPVLAEAANLSFGV
jgi:hypothetical protein